MVAGMQVASMFARIGADLTGLNSGLRTADSKLGQFGSKLAKWGGRAAMAAGAALAAAGGMAVKEAAGFESAVNLMGVAASGSGTSLDSLREAALEVGKDTQLIGIDAMEAADAITVLLKSGMSAADVFGNLDGYLEGTSDLGGALRASVDLAAASNLEFAESADAISVALATFGRPATDATAIADNFVATADASIAEVRDLTEAFVNVGPTANQFGWRLEDVNTALALLSQRGIRGSEAGTALKSMMTNLMRDTPAVTGTLNRLNISLYDQEGQMRALPDIVAELEGALSGLSEEERNLAIQTLAGTYGMKAMSTLVTEGEAGWQEMEANIEKAASSQEVARARTEGLAGAFEQLKGTIQTLLIEAGDPLIKNLLTPGVKWLTEFLGGFEDSGAIDIFAERVKKLGEYLFGREESWEYTPEFGLRYTPAQQGAIDKWVSDIQSGLSSGDWGTLFDPFEEWIDSGAYQETFRGIGNSIGQFLGDTIAAALGDESVSNAMARNLGKAIVRIPSMISWAAWQAGIEMGSKLRPIVGKEELSPERREAMGEAGIWGMITSVLGGLWEKQMSVPQRDLERLQQQQWLEGGKVDPYALGAAAWSMQSGGATLAGAPGARPWQESALAGSPMAALPVEEMQVEIYPKPPDPEEWRQQGREAMEEWIEGARQALGADVATYLQRQGLLHAARAVGVR